MYLHIHSLLSSYTFKYLNWSPKSDTNRCCRCRIRWPDSCLPCSQNTLYELSVYVIDCSFTSLITSQTDTTELMFTITDDGTNGHLWWMRRCLKIIHWDIRQHVRRIIYYNIWQHIRRIINWNRWFVGLRSMIWVGLIWDWKLPRPMLPIQIHVRLLSNDNNNNGNDNDKNRKRDENDSESGWSVDSKG